MKKNTIRIFTAALAAAMLLSVTALASDIPNPAAARANTEHKSATISRRTNGQSYNIYSSVYIDGSSAFASVWLRTANDAKVPSGSMGSQPMVFSNSGDTLATTSMEYSGTATYYWFQNTNSVRFTGYVHGGGNFELYNGSGYDSYVAPNTPNVQKAALVAQLSAQLDSNGEYPVNAQGMSYGSAMLAPTVGHQPDLISAVNEDGVTGYIRYADIHPGVTTREGALLHTALANENLTIPMYDIAGNEIGAFALSPVPDEAVDAAVTALNEMGDDAYQTALADLNLVDGAYPVNAKGQTYGPYGLIQAVGYAPDLISAVGEGGVAGYILQEDIEGPEVNTREQAFESMLMANDRLIIPLFDMEGKEIGTFHITPIPEEHVAGAREALTQLRGE